MSELISTPEQSSIGKPRRLLACVHCTRRKVKCDRQSPCGNCVKLGVQCAPATPAPRQRRRRFPERELLERLRHYEGLLRRNNINFEPLLTPAAEKTSPSDDSRGPYSPDDVQSDGPVAGADRPSRENTNVKSEIVYEAKSIWHAMNSEGPEEADEDNGADDNNDTDRLHNDLHESVIRKAWNQYGRNDHLLFGSRKTNVELSTLHPSQVHIFRLWQIYLDNVNQLLKVTHTPTLQTRIIDAASDVTHIAPPLEALMFSIYCVSILSLVESECQTLFGLSREDLLTDYQFGCQQALLNCEVLRTGDRDCLTALYLYLISVRTYTDPHTLSSMLGAAMRIAQRMGIHHESANSKCTVFEAEMRRRLWWSLTIFDNRICEMSDFQTTMLAPTWDCICPLNVNDSDIRPEMKILPVGHDRPTEALFAVVGSEVGEFIRHCDFHLEFTNPSLKSIAKDTQCGHVLEGSELIALERIMEENYFQFCNPENPLHMMTTWATRGYIARNRLLEHYSRPSTSSVKLTDTQRDGAIAHAWRMLECDTKLMASPLIKGFHWLLNAQFPFLAYIHIVHDLRKRPIGEQAEKSWEVMSDNYEVRFMDVNLKQDDHLLVKIFSRTVLWAWEERESAFGQLNKPVELPPIVSDIKQKMIHMMSNSKKTNVEQPSGTMGINSDDFSMPMPLDFGGYGLSYSMGGQGSAGSAPGAYPDIPAQATMDFDLNQSDWTMLDWNPMYTRGW